MNTKLYDFGIPSPTSSIKIYKSRLKSTRLVVIEAHVVCNAYGSLGHYHQPTFLVLPLRSTLFIKDNALDITPPHCSTSNRKQKWITIQVATLRCRNI